MAKRKPHPRVAVIGHVPDEFRSILSSVEKTEFPDTLDLAEAPADSLHKLRILLVGPDVDSNTLERWLPSLRIANPTMSVVGVGLGTVPKDLVNWVDDFCLTPESAKTFLDLFTTNNLLPDPLRSISGGVRKAGIQILIFSVLLALWWVFVATFNPPKFLLPSPVDVAESFLGQWNRFLMHLVTTAIEAILGFLLGNSLGICMAVILHRFFKLQKWTMPVLISFQAIPIVAFAPLLSVWLGTGLASKIAMAAIICFFPMVVNSLVAFSNVDREYLELFKLFRSSYSMEFRRLLLPACAPSIIAALKISAGLSVVGAIVAEMTGADKGLGYLLLNGAYRLETDLMFVAMLLSGLLGVVFFHMPEAVRGFLPRTWLRGLGSEVSRQR